MHHLSYGNWWVFICSLFGWYNFYSRQNKLLDIENNWGYIDILLSIFPLYFFHRYIPHCGDPDQLLMENFTNTLAGYLLAEFDQWEALAVCQRAGEERDWNTLMPPIFLRLTQICFIFNPMYCLLMSHETMKKTLWANLRWLDLRQEGQMPPLKVIESQMRKSGQYVTGF